MRPRQDAQFGYAIDGVLVSISAPRPFRARGRSGRDKAPPGRSTTAGSAEERLPQLVRPLSRGWYQQRFFGSQPEVQQSRAAGLRPPVPPRFTAAPTDHRRLSHFSAAATGACASVAPAHRESTAAAERAGDRHSAGPASRPSVGRRFESYAAHHDFKDLDAASPGFPIIGSRLEAADRLKGSRFPLSAGRSVLASQAARRYSSTRGNIM